MKEYLFKKFYFPYEIHKDAVFSDILAQRVKDVESIRSQHSDKIPVC